MQVRVKLATGTIDHRIGIGAPVVHDPVVDTKLAGEQRRATRKTRGIRGINILEHQRPGGDAVDIWGSAAQVPVAAEMVRPEGVDIDVQQSHRGQSIWIASPAQPEDAKVRGVTALPALKMRGH